MDHRQVLVDIFVLMLPVMIIAPCLARTGWALNLVWRITYATAVICAVLLCFMFRALGLLDAVALAVLVLILRLTLYESAQTRIVAKAYKTTKDQFLNDPTFREKLMKDPEAAARMVGGEFHHAD